MKIVFIGAGPGDPELITIKGLNRIKKADIVIHAGSLVNPEILQYASSDIPVYDSAGMDYKEVCRIYAENREKEGIIARIHTGDPSVYGTIQEQIDFCRKENIPWEVIPGISSFQAAAAALGQELTLPGVSQTVILSRISGRTAVPEKESLEKIAASRSSLILFLSISQIEKICAALAPIYGKSTVCVVVYRASWPDEQIIMGTLEDMAVKVEKARITRQALIMIGEVFRAQKEPFFYEFSKLYDPEYSHAWRKGSTKS